MSSGKATLAVVKQRLTRHLNDVKHILEDCERYKEGWQFPGSREELFVFIRKGP